MSRLLALAVAGLALTSGCAGTTGLAAGTTSGPGQHTVGGLRSGVFPVSDRDAAPELSGQTLTGRRLDVSTLRGKVVVLNVWASWCNPCQAEARNLNAVYAATRASGVEFVGIDIKDETAPALAFVRRHRVRYPNLEDQSGQLLLAFRGRAPQAPPTTLVLDRKGRVAAAFYGAAVTETQLLAPVRAVAAEAA